jgi:hypothetical protein
MSAKIIPLIPIEVTKTPKKELEQYVLAAWNFAQTLLWKEQLFQKDEVERAQAHIQEYFECAKDRKAAFTAFCERVLLTSRYLNANKSRYVPFPSIWFNRNYPHGFAGTKSWYQKVQLQRQDVPGYLQHLTTIADYYRQYAFRPSSAIFLKCRKKLIELKATSLLQHFYNCIIHLNYVN